MKEAAGEANMTVITIVLIGVVAAVGLVLIPRLMGNLKAKTCCTDGGGYVSGNNCCLSYNGNSCGSKYTLTADSFKNAERFSSCMAD